MERRHALVRPPTDSLVDGLVTHIERRPLELDLARQQWRAYVDALRANGWETTEVAPEPDCADAVFIEDAAFVFGDAAIACRSGAESRRAEVPPVADALVRAGYELITVEAPGTIDGGDVMKVGSTIYIGSGGRTNDAAIAAVAEALASRGATVVSVPMTKALHLKSAVTALPDGRVIGWEPIVDDPSLFSEFVSMPEESGAHVVDLGDGRLLMAADCPASHDLISDLGYQPVVVDIGEFEKLEGCVTCLSIRLR